jgi:hypothetical protein
MDMTLVAVKSQPKYTRGPNTTRQLTQENCPDLAKQEGKNGPAHKICKNHFFN